MSLPIFATAAMRVLMKVATWESTSPLRRRFISTSFALKSVDLVLISAIESRTVSNLFSSTHISCVTVKAATSWAFSRAVAIISECAIPVTIYSSKNPCKVSRSSASSLHVLGLDAERFFLLPAGGLTAASAALAAASISSPASPA